MRNDVDLLALAAPLNAEASEDLPHALAGQAIGRSDLLKGLAADVHGDHPGLALVVSGGGWVHGRI